MVFHEGRQAIRTNDRKMSSHLLAQHLRLAQNDKRKSEHDGRGDHGSELGKYRPESARSELQRLAPCSPTKIVHVGLHAATSCRALHPAPAHQSGGSMQGNNSPVNKRTVRRRRKIGTWHAVAAARRRPGSPCFRRGFPDCALASVGPWRQVNDADIRSVARSAPHLDLYRPLIRLYRPLPTHLAVALKGCA
jgi:hypothetical protein